MPLNEEWDTDLFLEALKNEIESRELCYHMSSKRKNNPSNEYLRRENMVQDFDPDGRDHDRCNIISCGEQIHRQKSELHILSA